MKWIFALLLYCLSGSVCAHTSTYQQLKEVNKCWAEHKEVDSASLPAYAPHDDRGWIQLHLSLVEQSLRAHMPQGLSQQQRAARLHCLDHLHEYWQAGRFPQNEDYTYRTPIFIDRHDNFCAVGYLVKTSGYEAVSRMIAAKTNLAYVREMHYPELTQWATTHGFTTDELAWIQPGYSYPPSGRSKPVGHGVDGVVEQLFADTVGSKLFVGGTFAHADSAIVANNIAFLTPAGAPDTYTWHAMGNGVGGSVSAICRYGSTIFVAGSFTTAGDSVVNNVARWDTGWSAAGCVSAGIRRFCVYNGDLYAAGSFTVCAGSTTASLAKWTGSDWAPITGISGTINAMLATDTALLLGGSMYNGTDSMHVLRWSTAGGLSAFTNVIPHTVNDLCIHDGDIYAACMKTDPDSIHLLYKLVGTSWTHAMDDGVAASFNAIGDTLSLNTLLSESGRLDIGGRFIYSMAGTFGVNNFCMNGSVWCNLDSTVCTQAFFGTNMFEGGKFIIGDNTSNWGSESVILNGICIRHISGVGVETVQKTGSCTLFPNPATGRSAMVLTNDFHATHFVVRDAMARMVAMGGITGDRQELKLLQLQPGVYTIDVTADDGVRKVEKFVIY